MKIIAARRSRLLRISKIAVQDIQTYPHRQNGVSPNLKSDDVVVKVAQTSSQQHLCRRQVVQLAVVPTRHVLFSSIQTGSFLTRRLHARL